MKSHTTYLTFTTKRRHEIIDITDEVEKCRAAAGITLLRVPPWATVGLTVIPRLGRFICAMRAICSAISWTALTPS